MNAVRKRWMVIGGVGAALALLIVWLMWPRSVEVEAATVGRGPIAETVSDQGYARVREAYVVAAPVSGRLERISLKVGDRVTAGRTLVARIRPAAADLLDPRARAQAEATVSAAQASVTASIAERERLAAEQRRSEQDLNRVSTLARQGYASAQALETAQAAARAATAAVEAGDAGVRARKAELAAARAALTGPDAPTPAAIPVLAPASGYVTRLIQTSERTVAMGEPLIEVSAGDGLEAAIEFLSQDAVRLREGMAAELFDWGGPGTIPARVRRIEPQGFTKISALGVEEQRVLVLLQFTGAPEKWSRLGPGYRVWGRVTLRQASSVLKVPLGALVREAGGWSVFRIDGGRARLVPVRIGAMTDDEAEVLKGLEAGQRVVVFPSDKVRDRSAVHVRR